MSQMFDQNCENNKNVMNISLNETQNNTKLSNDINAVNESEKVDFGNLIDDMFNQMTCGELSTSEVVQDEANPVVQSKEPANAKAGDAKKVHNFLDLYNINEKDYETDVSKIPNYSYWDRIALHTRDKGLINEIPIYDLEMSTFNRIKTPGINRYKMPEIPQKSQKLRQYEMSKFIPFVDCDEPELKRRLILKKFESDMKERFPTREWSFRDRSYLEKFDEYNYKHAMNTLCLLDPQVYTSYFDLDDALLVTLYYESHREQITRKIWNCPWNVKPDMPDWIEYFIDNQENYDQKLFYELDPLVYGRMYSTRDLINPRNKAMFLIDKYHLMNQDVVSTKVCSQSVCFGIHDKITFGGIEKIVKRSIKHKTEEELEAERLAEEEAAKAKKGKKEEVEEVKPTVIRYEFHEDNVVPEPDSCDSWLQLSNSTRLYFEIEKFFNPNLVPEEEN